MFDSKMIEIDHLRFFSTISTVNLKIHLRGETFEMARTLKEHGAHSFKTNREVGMQKPATLDYKSPAEFHLFF